MDDDMKLFVTGGAGYIGSVFVPYALGKGYEITVCDELYFGKDTLRNVKNDIIIKKKNTTKITLDDLKGMDAIIDFAAMSGDMPPEFDDITYAINYKARSRLCKLGAEAGVQRYIAPSSCSVYGITAGLATEDGPVNPLTSYAKANYLWEKDALTQRSKDYCVTVLRQSTVYGASPRMRFDLLVNTFTRDAFLNKKIKIKGNGQEHRPFIHVKDDCRAFVRVLEADTDEVNGETFNVGTDNIKVIDLMDKVAHVIGVDCGKETGEWVDKRDYTVSFDKFEHVLGLDARVDIKHGVREVYDALANGTLDPNDKRTVTIGWYQYLLQHNKHFGSAYKEYVNGKTK